MGIREDIRNALGSIAAAIPEAVATMRHGEDESGDVVQSSSRDFADVISGEAPAIAASYVANAADFPTLENGAAVEIGGSLRVVVSLRRDPVAATFTAGVSAEFENCPATYTGTRRVNGAARTINHPLDVLLLENGAADTLNDSFAPSYATSYLVAIRRTDWRETTDPEPSDTVTVAPDGQPLVLKVSTAERHGGWYVLKCRTRG